MKKNQYDLEIKAKKLDRSKLEWFVHPITLLSKIETEWNRSLSNGKHHH